MTSLSFDAVELKSRLSRLSQRQILTFGVWQLERMTPNFVQFCVETRSEGAWVLKRVVSYAWSVIETGIMIDSARLLIEDCEKIAPNTEDFKSLYTSSALDAVISASNLIEYSLTSEIELVVEMSSLARDSADMLIQFCSDLDQYDEGFEEAVRTHPLMQSELQYQRADIEFLEHQSEGEGYSFFEVLDRSLNESYGRKWL